MITEDQTEVVEFLASPDTHAGAAVERIETHASIVFAAGTRAWKLKRAVRYDYLDFSTAEQRRLMCEAEVRINRRTAPTVYRRVVAVTREHDGSLALGGSGAAVDWLEDCCIDSNISGSGDTESADEHAGFIAQDIAKEIRRHDDFELFRSTDEFHRAGVHEHFVQRDLRIFFCNFQCHRTEQSTGLT